MFFFRRKIKRPEASDEKPRCDMKTSFFFEGNRWALCSRGGMQGWKLACHTQQLGETGKKRFVTSHSVGPLASWGFIHFFTQISCMILSESPSPQGGILLIARGADRLGWCLVWGKKHVSGLEKNARKKKKKKKKHTTCFVEKNTCRPCAPSPLLQVQY